MVHYTVLTYTYAITQNSQEHMQGVVAILLWYLSTCELQHCYVNTCMHRDRQTGKDTYMNRLIQNEWRQNELFTQGFLSALFTGCIGTQLSTWSVDLCPKFTMLDLLKRQKKVISQIEVQPSSAFNSNHCTPRLIEHHSVTEKASYDEEAVETGNSWFPTSPVNPPLMSFQILCYCCKNFKHR